MATDPVKIMNTFYIGNSRNVYVDGDNDVSIADDETGKRAFFIARRWVKFVQEIPMIDRAVRRAVMYKPTKFKLHVGGRWYVAVSDQFQTVDIRKWFIRVGSNGVLLPSTRGISLSFTQWKNLILKHCGVLEFPLRGFSPSFRGFRRKLS